MIRMSRLSDYGIAIMCHMAMQPEALVSARTLSRHTHISESAIMKILKLLVKAELVHSVRGAKGGYALNGTPEAITILDLVRAIEGDVSLTLCAEQQPGSSPCDYQSGCIAHFGWNRVNQAMQQTLADFSIADFVEEYQQALTTIPGPASLYASKPYEESYVTNN